MKVANSVTEIDEKIRHAAFNWLADQVKIYGEVLPRTILAKGFTINNQHVPLVSPQGIFKPQNLTIPLSITSTPKSPYDDKIDYGGYLLYKYRGTNPNHLDNVGLRNAMIQKIPLVYLRDIIPGKYLAVWPIYIIEDNPKELTFRIAVDIDSKTVQLQGAHILSDVDEKTQRSYTSSVIQQRLHQHSFREKVLYAYREQCAFCRLKHQELLDAAHIIPDGEPDGLPIVPNGISLCKLHHAAFDRMFLGIRPDGVIEVSVDILEEDDGPMLIHGLKELHQKKMLFPRTSDSKPDPRLLLRRYERFKKAC